MKKALKLEEFKSFCNLPVQLIPIIVKKDTVIKKTKKQQAVMLHTRSMNCLEKIDLDGVHSIDLKNRNLDNKSFRELLLSIPSRHNKEQKLFMSIDKHYNRDHYVVTICKKFAEEATDKLFGIGKLLEMQYGNGIYSKWFSHEARLFQEQLQWDVTNDRPISTEEQEIDEALNTDIPWLFENIEVVGGGDNGNGNEVATVASC